MNKKLKKRILEEAGMTGEVPKRERLEIAAAIMTNEDYKQQLCNLIPGVSFKDVENVMKGFARQYMKEQTEEDELREMAPEKFDPQPIKPPKPRPSDRAESADGIKHGDNQARYGTYSKEDVQRLMAATAVTTDDRFESPKQGNYINYTKEEVAALMNCNYNPEHFKYLHKKKEPNRDE